MTLPSVSITELDGALGILPPSTGLHAVLAVADAGPVNTPAAFARGKDVVSNFSGGPGVEYASYELERYGRPLVFNRVNATTAGAYGTVTKTGTGTSVVTGDGTIKPSDDYDVVITIKLGGTIGTGPISYTWSLDGGRQTSPVIALGTQNSITLPGNVKLNFGAGTTVTGDTYTLRTTAPLWSASDLSAGLTALQNSSLPWEFVHIIGPVDATAFSTIAGAMTAMHNVGKHRWAVCSARIPTVGETDSAYQTSIGTTFASSSSVDISLWAGSAKIDSSISRRQYRRPPSWAAAARFCAVSEEHDIAELDDGPLPGVSILDSNGNPDDHNEAVNPGLDDLKFGTLRTFDSYTGVFITNPRILCPTGSDFLYAQFRRVMNIARTVLGAYLVKRLSKALRVDASTGFIREEDRRDIEMGANAVLRTALTTKPKVSSVTFTLSKTDNVLSTQTLTGQCRIVPLAYPKQIVVDIGFVNPALRLLAA